MRRQATLFQAWGARPTPRRDAEDDDESAAAWASSWPGGFVGGPAGELWLFPAGAGLEERRYQVRAARAALESNTLLCLPTGLGKTLVAAVVLHNFYRWFPAGRALFLAPTKPLVAQQKDACARLLAIPPRHMAQITGGTQVVDRKEMWQNKRVFFLTPQILVNDLSRGICPAAEVKCLVIDEAHKALGNHAYCQVVKELCKYTQQFRILALSATPGSDLKAVQQVISNLLISHIELCSEDSPEIQPYSYERLVEKCVVPLGEELSEMRAAYIRVLEAFAGRLIRFRVLSQRDISALTKYQIILARDQFRKNPASHFTGPQQGIIEGDFALCISLCHGYELLLQMGMRSLHIFLSGIVDGSKGMTRARNELRRNEEFMTLYSQLESMFAETSETSANGNVKSGKGKMKPFIYSHPKLKKLEEVVVEHFRSRKEHGDQKPVDSRPGNTRVMIFSSFRDSVHEIAEMLSRHHPIVRVMAFVGHSTGKSAKGFTQKEQLEVVKRFRAGGYNTLVSTCVGEEGLDIGEVDLIVCFDAQKSPIRLVQRMGRTGRKRQGRIVVILSEGREERTYNQSQSNKRSLFKAISENKVLRFYQHSPRMIPEGVNPKMHRMLITPPACEQDHSPPSPTGGRALSLQQKWLPGYAGAGAKQTDSSESWYLTAEEFEVWKKSYRVKAEDGIKQPVMPRCSFETLEDGVEKTDLRAEEVHELSLTEWRLWQNRPFPTRLVDHSDRCLNFISVMKVIEQMRYEEGDSSYELRLRPHFHREDVDASVLKRRKSVPDSAAPPKASSSRKTLGAASEGDCRSSSSQDLDDAERLSLFRVAGSSSKRPQTRGVAAEGHGGESSSCSGLMLLFEEDAGADVWPDESQGPGRASGGSENAAAGGSQGAAKGCRSGGGLNAEPDSGRFSEGNLPLPSSPFYLPALEKDPFALSVPCTGEDPPCGREVLLSATWLLSQSPPSWNELFAFESTGEAPRPDSEQQCISSGCADSDPPEKLSSSSEFQKPSVTSQNTSGLPDFPKPSPWSNCVLEASVGNDDADLAWDDVFDNSDEVQIGAERRDSPGAESSLETDAGGGRGAFWEHPGRNGRPAEEQGSEFLFQRQPASERSSHLEREGGKCSGPQGSCSQASTPAEDPGTSRPRLPSERVREGLGEPASPLSVIQDQALGAVDDAGEAELYDVSQDLFSVNFDLGFSLPESEDEELEPGGLKGDNESHVAGGSLSSGQSARRDSPLAWSASRLERTKVSTPAPSQNRNSGLAMAANVIPGASPLRPTGDKLCRSPVSVKWGFSTPKSRRTMNSPASRGAKLSCFFGNRLGSPQGAAPSKARTGTVRKPSLANAAEGIKGFASEGTGNGECKNQKSHNLITAEVGASSGSEEEVVFLGKRKRNVLISPKNNNSSEADSPVQVVRKRRRPLDASDRSSDESTGSPRKANQTGAGESRNPGRGAKRQKQQDGGSLKSAAKQFLEEEAELSDEGAVEVSSDEMVDSEQDEMSSSLKQFLDDETQIVQDLNESEMQAVYLKSVRSPAVGNRRERTVPKPCDPAAIFSQVPEPDESYLVDSFCVQEGEEEEGQPKGSSSEGEEICLNFDLLEEETFAEGRKQYCTRRRRKLKEASAKKPWGPLPLRKKPSRIRILDDSSEDEGGVRPELLGGLPPDPKPGAGSGLAPARAPVASLHRGIPSPKSRIHLPRESRAQQVLLNLRASLADELDFQPQGSKEPGRLERLSRGDLRSTAKPEVSSELPAAPCSSSSSPPRLPLGEPAPLCILADSREISSGPEVISALKAVHGVKVQVCPLGGCDYVVSNRLAVERKGQAELLNGAQRSKVAQRVQQLKSKFDRICVIVEKERARAGEAQKDFHRTQPYDGVLSAFIRAGIRVLFSSCQEETAGLLKELALVERRKNAAILVPTEVQGPGQEAFQFYLSMPCISYATALALCHRFCSVKEVTNSSPKELAARAQVSLQKAEEIYHYLRHGFDKQMLPERVT
ncbi:Fanconi anemia group M protein [Heteronotia binoei]|uniref:Fanconi anemia group M protein n=1 Tax=Heteronotia binoei TaxID=13085 RepID=UPI00292F45A5|nr:Fanconi anemia group M protein [Heteronotia binoei]